MPLFEIDRAGRRAAGGWIWRNVSLRVDPGAGLGVVGPSGAGKSLFLRALAGLDDLDEGRIRFRDRRIEEWPMPEYRARVVYLHQRPPLLEGSVEDNLRAVFRFAAHRHRRYDRERALALLDRLGRSESFLERSATLLSGGEAQMVAVVRALLLEPLALLLDEPAASLDPESGARAEELILGWHSSGEERVLLLTSHDRAQVERLCTQTLTLE